ncbi:phage tail protein [Musicola paradisiaca]|uniref:Tail Collar domain protein n=1 Tax=Musicola paradisiaca (strain Ech703) TaxID=579405 RepID=C6C6Z0_MUSP7|nr:phage tail protein [Musicola paradisiaca]ACS85884.1 Tail Collar domain protein [Musicola paradisiaca Ech703]
MKKSHAIDLTLGKENFYKNNRVRIDNISVCCCKCADESVDSLKALIGIPQPWPLADAPEGWLKCNGQAFDTAKYPELAKCYPSGTLPDLRGEFIRGWDDGRGVDTSRELVSAQSGTYITGDSDSQPSVQGIGNITECHVDSPDSNARSIYWIPATKTDRLTGPTYWGVTRPRNISFNYIVKAG